MNVKASYVIMVIGILMLASNGYDEYRGITRAPSAGRYYRGSRDPVIKQNQPENFHNAMTYHWSISILVLMAGFILNVIVRGQDKADPLSPDYAGNEALDKWGKAMDEEAKRRKKLKP